jgi:anti-anti-sigma factor
LLTVEACPVSPDTVVITVCGEVDLHTSPSLQVGLFTHLGYTRSRLVIDLTGVGFFGAAGLTVLLAARAAATTSGIAMCLVTDARPMLRLLAVTGLDSVFDVHPDLAEALSGLGGPDG